MNANCLLILAVSVSFVAPAPNSAPLFKPLVDRKSVVDNPDSLSVESTIHLSEQLKDQTVETGQTLILDCEATGAPQAIVTWQFNGRDVTNLIYDIDSNVVEKVENYGMPTIETAVTRGRLRLVCVVPVMEGLYSCVADNGRQKVLSSARVTVARGENAMTSQECELNRKRQMSSSLGSRKNVALGIPAQIYMWTDGRFELEGNSVQLFCRAKGSPQPRVTWTDPDMMPITDRRHNYQVLWNGDLLIKKADFSQLGVYTCTAENGHGKDSVEVFFYPTAAEEQDSDEEYGLIQQDYS